MGGDCSQKLLPQRGLSFLSGASSTSGSCKINTLAQALPDVAWSDYPEERLSKVGVARRRTQLPTAWVNFGKQRWATSRERRRKWYARSEGWQSKSISWLCSRRGTCGDGGSRRHRRKNRN